MQDKFSEEFYCVKGVDERLVGTGFGIFTIIEPYRYELKHSPYNATFVKCECNLCKNQTFKDLAKMKAGISINECQECTRNQYIELNEKVSILKIYDFVIENWIPVFVNTECLDLLKSYGKWSIRRGNRGCCRIKTSVPHNAYMYRVIVDYINSKYNLPKLLDNQEIDHIDGNTFNNLYYPYDDYYNNLRVCDDYQNSLNRPCKGYTIDKNTGRYAARISVRGVTHGKTFHTPQECIDYNNSLVSKLSPEDAKYYYNHPDNPRNWPWTYSNSVLKPLGFTDDDFAQNEDFDNIEWEDDVE